RRPRRDARAGTPAVSGATHPPAVAPAVRRDAAKQAIDYGRRGMGYLFGALRATTGDTRPAPYPSRSTVNFVALLEQVEAWRPPEAARVDAVLDNLESHRATDVLLFALAHPRARSSCSSPRPPPI